MGTGARRAGDSGVKEIPIGYHALRLYQSDKWESSVTWCQVMAGDEYCAGFYVTGKEQQESVARTAEAHARELIAKGFDR